MILLLPVEKRSERNTNGLKILIEHEDWNVCYKSQMWFIIIFCESKCNLPVSFSCALASHRDTWGPVICAEKNPPTTVSINDIWSFVKYCWASEFTTSDVFLSSYLTCFQLSDGNSLGAVIRGRHWQINTHSSCVSAPRWAQGPVIPAFKSFNFFFSFCL